MVSQKATAKRLLMEEIKVKHFALTSIMYEETALQHENNNPSVKHGSGSIVWTCFAACGSGHLVIFDSLIEQ